MLIVTRLSRLVAVLLLTVSLTFAEGRKRRILYRISQVAYLAASGLDIGTSWGKYELNPLMRSANGTMGWRGAGIKLGIGVGTIGIQEWVVRRNRKAEVSALVFNFAAAGIAGIVSGHNLGVPGRGDPPRLAAPGVTH